MYTLGMWVARPMTYATFSVGGIIIGIAIRLNLSHNNHLQSNPMYKQYLSRALFWTSFLEQEDNLWKKNRSTPYGPTVIYPVCLHRLTSNSYFFGSLGL